MEIGYKVVDTYLRSCMILRAIASESRYAVQYCENEWTFPVNSEMPLMVFENKELAEKFIEMEKPSYEKWRLFECEFERSEKEWGWCFFSIAEQLRRKKYGLYPYFGDLPTGTILADKVRLLSEIHK